MISKFIYLGDVCEVQNGYAFDSKYFSSEPNGGMPLIRIRDILNGFTETYYSGDYQDEYIVKQGDYLIGMDGDFNIGQWKSEDALLNQRVCRLLPSERVLPKFIYYYIPSALQTINDATTYTTVKHLSSKQVKGIRLPALSLTEQQRIVDILDAEFEKIDALKVNAECNLQHAKDLFECSLQEVYASHPEWEWDTIGNLCKTGAGGTPSKLHKEYYEGGTVPWLRSGEVCQKYINKTEMFITEKGLENSSAHWFPEDTVLVAMYGATAGQVGILKTRATTNQAVCGILPNSRFVPEFLYYSLLRAQKELVAKATGNAQPNISQIKVKGTTVPVLTVEEQRVVVARLDDLNDRCKALQANYERTITLCDDLKKSLLRKAFSGEL